jgi:hypothetical protein
MEKSKKRSSTGSWILIHVIFPMLPFIIEGIIRLSILDFSINLQTFSSTTLAASIGLLCIFINQNLLAHEIPLPDEYEQSRIFEGLVFIFCFFPIATAIQTQRSFKLRAVI